MNRNGFSNYEETTADSLSETRLFLDGIAAKKSTLVEPIITPRFVPSCDNELLAGLGDIAAKTGVRIQSHLAESKPEVNNFKSVKFILT